MEKELEKKIRFQKEELATKLLGIHPMIVPDDEDIKKVENKVKVEITSGKAEGYDFTIVGFFLKKDSTFLRWLALVDVDGLMKDMEGEDSASYENLLKEID